MRTIRRQTLKDWYHAANPDGGFFTFGEGVRYRQMCSDGYASSHKTGKPQWVFFAAGHGNGNGRHSYSVYQLDTLTGRIEELERYRGIPYRLEAIHTAKALARTFEREVKRQQVVSGKGRRPRVRPWF